MRFIPVSTPKPYKKPCFKLSPAGNKIIYVSRAKGTLRVCYGTISSYNYLNKTTIYRGCSVRWDGKDLWYDSRVTTFDKAMELLPRLQEVYNRFPDLPDGIDTWYEVE